MNVYLLYSDGTWSTCPEEKTEEVIEHHWWPFPIDIKGDPRRKVKIIKNLHWVTTVKGV